MSLRSYILMLCLMFPFGSLAQEEMNAINYGKRYLDINTRKLEKYTLRLKHQQVSLLKKLSRKEEKLAKKLKSKDSVAYTQLADQPITYDSIQRLSKPDSTILAKKNRRNNKRLIA